MARRQAYDVADPYEYTPRFGLRNSMQHDFRQLDPRGGGGGERGGGGGERGERGGGGERGERGGGGGGGGVMVPIPPAMMNNTRCYGIVQKWDPESGVGRIRELGTMKYLTASEATLNRSGGADKLPVYFYNRSVRRMDVYVGQMVEYIRVLEKSGFVAHDALPLHNFKVAFDVVRPYVNRPNFLPMEVDTIDARQAPHRLVHTDFQAFDQTRPNSFRQNRQPTRQPSSHHDSFIPSRPTTRQDATRQDATRQDATRQDATRQDATRRNIHHDSHKDAPRRDDSRRDSHREATRQEVTRQEVTRQDATRQDDSRHDLRHDTMTRRDTRRLEDPSIKVGSPHQEETPTSVKHEKEEDQCKDNNKRDNNQEEEEEDQEDQEDRHQSDDVSNDDEEEEEDTRRKDSKRKPVQRDFDEPRKRLRIVRTAS